MDEKSLIILCLSLISALVGGFFSQKAKKTKKLAFLIISMVFAVICFVGIILAVISMYIAKNKMV